MSHSRTQGFTLIELLIVIAIIGILSVLLLPNLLRARSVAVDRTALNFAANVYRAGQAYLSENMDHSVAAGACGTGTTATTFGSYVVPGPGTYITSCAYTAGVTKVTITYSNGTSNALSIGQ